MEKFSTLMSVYNGENEFLFERCLASLSMQIDRQTEFVLVIDGPLRPALWGVIDKYSEILKINVHQLDVNVGLADALDYGYQKCVGDWIVRCDSDDFYQPQHLHLLKQKCLCVPSDCAVVGSSIEELLYPGFKTISLRTYPAKVKTVGASLRDPFAHPAVAIRASALTAVGGYEGPLYFEDTYLWLRLFNAGYYGLNICNFLVQMSVSDDFYERRRGIKYAKFEALAFWRFFNESLLTWPQMFILPIRLMIRFLPRVAFKRVYNLFLRN